MIGMRELRDIEPNVVAKKALYAPNSAVVDFRKIAAVYTAIFEKAGGILQLNTEFLGSYTRITSYNVCYTKLLRRSRCLSTRFSP